MIGDAREKSENAERGANHPRLRGIHFPSVSRGRNKGEKDIRMLTGSRQNSAQMARQAMYRRTLGQNRSV